MIKTKKIKLVVSDHIVNSPDNIFSKTQLSVRGKCPPGFILVARSRKVDSKGPRGGVAIYKKESCHIRIELIYNGLRDCVICRILDTNIIIIGLYIPPINSEYFTDTYFKNLDLIYEKL